MRLSKKKRGRRSDGDSRAQEVQEPRQRLCLGLGRKRSSKLDRRSERILQLWHLILHEHAFISSQRSAILFLCTHGKCQPLSYSIQPTHKHWLTVAENEAHISREDNPIGSPRPGSGAVSLAKNFHQWGKIMKYNHSCWELSMWVKGAATKWKGYCR